MNDDFHKRLLQLRGALLDRALSLLPPNATSASPDVSEEAVNIFEALASTPVPPKTSDYAIRVSSKLDPSAAHVMELLGLTRAFGIPRAAFRCDVERPAKSKPVLGVRGGHLVVLGDGRVRVSMSDGNLSVIDVKATDRFGKVVDAVKRAVLAFAEADESRMGRLLGWRSPDSGLGSLTSGKISIGVDDGPLTVVMVARNESLGAILIRVHGAVSDIAEKHHEAKPSPVSRPPTTDFVVPPASSWDGIGTVLGMKDGKPVVLNNGRIQVWTSEMHRGYADVSRGQPIADVAVALRESLLSEIDRLVRAGTERLFERAWREALVRRPGKVFLRTSDGNEVSFDLSVNETLGTAYERIGTALRAMAGDAPLFGMKDGRFTTLRASKLVLGETWTEGAPIPVVSGDSLERVLDRIKEALVLRAGGEVVKDQRLVGSNALGDGLVGSNALDPEARREALVDLLAKFHSVGVMIRANEGGAPPPERRRLVNADLLGQLDHLTRQAATIVFGPGAPAGGPFQPQAPEGAGPILGIVDGQATVLRDGELQLSVWSGGAGTTLGVPARKALGFHALGAGIIQTLTVFATGDDPGPFSAGIGQVVKDGSVALSDGVRKVGFPLTAGLSYGKVTAQLRDLAVLLAARSDPASAPLPDHKGLAAVLRAAAGPLAPETFDSVEIIFVADHVRATAEFSAAQVRTILAGGDPWKEPAAPASKGGFLYAKTVLDGVFLMTGTNLVPDAPLPKGRAEVVKTGRYYTGDAIPCVWKGEGSCWPTIARWSFTSPPAGVSTYATSEP